MTTMLEDSARPGADGMTSQGQQLPLPLPTVSPRRLTLQTGSSTPTGSLKRKTDEPVKSKFANLPTVCDDLEAKTISTDKAKRFCASSSEAPNHDHDALDLTVPSRPKSESPGSSSATISNTLNGSCEATQSRQLAGLTSSDGNLFSPNQACANMIKLNTPDSDMVQRSGKNGIETPTTPNWYQANMTTGQGHTSVYDSQCLSRLVDFSSLMRQQFGNANTVPLSLFATNPLNSAGIPLLPGANPSMPSLMSMGLPPQSVPQALPPTTATNPSDALWPAHDPSLMGLHFGPGGAAWSGGMGDLINYPAAMAAVASLRAANPPLMPPLSDALTGLFNDPFVNTITSSNSMTPITSSSSEQVMCGNKLGSGAGGTVNTSSAPDLLAYDLLQFGLRTAAIAAAAAAVSQSATTTVTTTTPTATHCTPDGCTDLSKSATTPVTSAIAIPSTLMSNTTTMVDDSMTDPNMTGKSPIAGNPIRKYASHDECGSPRCRASALREHFHCRSCNKVIVRREEMIRHAKWHRKREESLQYGFMRYSPGDNCTMADCVHNGRQTHYHCLKPNCTKVYISTSDVQMHANFHRKDAVIIQEGFQRFRASEDCGTAGCPFYQERTTHFHCRRTNCRFTFKNKADMEKHKLHHQKNDSFAKDGFRKYIKCESCGFSNCKYSGIINHIHCIRPGCDYVVHSSSQILSHKRKHDRRVSQLVSSPNANPMLNAANLLAANFGFDAITAAGISMVPRESAMGMSLKTHTTSSPIPQDPSSSSPSSTGSSPSSSPSSSCAASAAVPVIGNETIDTKPLALTTCSPPDQLLLSGGDGGGVMFPLEMRTSLHEQAASDEEDGDYDEEGEGHIDGGGIENGGEAETENNNEDEDEDEESGEDSTDFEKNRNNPSHSINWTTPEAPSIGSYGKNDLFYTISRLVTRCIQRRQRLQLTSPTNASPRPMDDEHPKLGLGPVNLARSIDRPWGSAGVEDNDTGMATVDELFSLVNHHWREIEQVKKEEEQLDLKMGGSNRKCMWPGCLSLGPEMIAPVDAADSSSPTSYCPHWIRHVWQAALARHGLFRCQCEAHAEGRVHVHCYLWPVCSYHVTGESSDWSSVCEHLMHHDARLSCHSADALNTGTGSSKPPRGNRLLARNQQVSMGSNLLSTPSFSSSTTTTTSSSINLGNKITPTLQTSSTNEVTNLLAQIQPSTPRRRGRPPKYCKYITVPRPEVTESVMCEDDPQVSYLERSMFNVQIPDSPGQSLKQEGECMEKARCERIVCGVKLYPSEDAKCPDELCEYSSHRVEHYHCVRPRCFMASDSLELMNVHRREFHQHINIISGFEHFDRSVDCRRITCHSKNMSQHYHCTRPNCDYAFIRPTTMMQHARKHEEALLGRQSCGGTMQFRPTYQQYSPTNSSLPHILIQPRLIPHGTQLMGQNPFLPKTTSNDGSLLATPPCLPLGLSPMAAAHLLTVSQAQPMSNSQFCATDFSQARCMMKAEDLTTSTPMDVENQLLPGFLPIWAAAMAAAAASVNQQNMLTTMPTSAATLLPTSGSPRGDEVDRGMLLLPSGSATDLRPETHRCGADAEDTSVGVH